MSKDRKKPGWLAWTIVSLSVLLTYPMSYGPAEWLFARGWLPRSSSPALTRFYYPVSQFRSNGPEPIRAAVEWYSEVGKP